MLLLAQRRCLHVRTGPPPESRRVTSADFSMMLPSAAVSRAVCRHAATGESVTQAND